MEEEELLRKFKNLSLKDPKNDILFKNLFGQKCNEEKTKSILKAIISNAEINENNSPEIDEIEYYNVELHTSKYSEKERTTIVDIHAKDNKNEVDYLIEMQVLNDRNMLNRTEFNNSKILQTFYERGKPLSTKQKVYSINILCFNIFHTDDENYDKYFHTLFTHEPGDVENSIQNQVYIFIELPRFKYENFEKGNMLHCWLSFLKSVKVTSEKIEKGKNKERSIENENTENENTENENIENENIENKNIENENIENENIENENIENEDIQKNIKKKFKKVVKINIPFNVFKEIIKVKEIRESFDICEKSLEKIDEDNYSSYLNVVSEMASALQYAKEKEKLAREKEKLAREKEKLAREKEKENNELKNENERKEKENNELKNENESIKYQLNELKKLMNEMIKERKEEINNESNDNSKKQRIL